MPASWELPQQIPPPGNSLDAKAPGWGQIFGANPQGVYSDMYMTGGSAQTFFGIPKKINTRKNQTQKNKFMKITDPKK